MLPEAGKICYVKAEQTGLHMLYNQVVRNILHAGKTTGLSNIISRFHLS